MSINRRGFLAGITTGALSVGVNACSPRTHAARVDQPAAAAQQRAYSIGDHQPGVTSMPPSAAALVSLDLAITSRGQLLGLFQLLTKRTLLLQGRSSAAGDMTVTVAVGAGLFGERLDQVRRVLVARRRHRQGPHRLAFRLGMARSTIYGVLRRHGQSRLAHTDRASGIVVRYQREHPGELVHIDVKKLGRIPDGGGHRAHGRAASTPRGLGIGYDDLHSAVDDRSRVAFSQILPDESAPTAALFLLEAASFFADHGVTIQRVLTDNAKAYAQSLLFAETAAILGITLKRTRRYRPQTNGKVERFSKTLLEEWADRRLYRSNSERRRAFRRWLRFSNHRRPHTALDGLTPMAVLVNNAAGNRS